MADEKMLAAAGQVYATLCQALDERDWRYDRVEKDLVVRFGVNGEDIPIQFVILVDAERQMVRCMSMLPFKMSESKRIEGAIAACAASYGMADGSFDYDVTDGTLFFRMTASFRESRVGTALFSYLIDCSCAMVDRYNDKFLALDKGMLSINDFITQA